MKTGVISTLLLTAGVARVHIIMSKGETTAIS